MSDFMNAYSLTGSDYQQWKEGKTVEELRPHLIEVAFHLDSVPKCREKIAREKAKAIHNQEEVAKLEKKLKWHEEELRKETADLVILAKHFVLSFGGGDDMLGGRHAKFKRQ